MGWNKIFNISLIYATLRSATPLIYAALCASITQQANILNVGTEGIMLTGAFFAVAVSYATGAWYLGVLAAMLAGLMMAGIMAVGHIKFRADITAIGIGVNIFALALTKFLLNIFFNLSGTISSPQIKPIPRVRIPALEDAGKLAQVFNDWAFTEWFVFVLIFGLSFLLYKTIWGLRLRAVGQHPMAAQSVGIQVDSMKYKAMLISGLIGGLAGAHLSLGYSALFTENMTNNRGFMGVAAMYFGGADPIKTTLGCVVFGFSDSVGARLQPYGLSSQIVLMMPYLVTILVLAISMFIRMRRDVRKKSALMKG